MELILGIIISVLISGIAQVGAGSIIRFLILKRPCKRKLTAVCITVAIAILYYAFVYMLSDESGVYGLIDLIMAMINYNFLFKPNSDANSDK